MDIYTCQMANWRKARDLGIPVFDITLKSGDVRFAPDAELLSQYKSGKITDQYYTQRYLTLMDQRLKEDPKLLDVITKEPALCLMCYCGPGKFCHRHLLTEWLSRHIKIAYQGEIRKEGLEQLTYPSLTDQLFPERIGVIWDGTDKPLGASILKQIQARHPLTQWVVLGNPTSFLRYAERNHWFVRKFSAEDANQFYHYCTRLHVFTTSLNYNAPISWERQLKPTEVIKV